MLKKVSYDNSQIRRFVSSEEVNSMKRIAEEARNTLVTKSGEGNDFLGWVDLPIAYDKEEFDRIKKAAEKIRNDSEVLIVIGIGGSYLGARAAIEFLCHGMYNKIDKETRKAPEIYFVGNNMSTSYIKSILDVLADRDFSINVISKSGTTTEPAIAFRIFKEVLETKYGKKGAAERIYATTDRERGALRTLADKAGYQTFVIPDDVGGRFSVLTPVGLLPIAVNGVNLDLLMEGSIPRMRKMML